jgi:radical SAM protein with 4Fe4S-binding SPASM domain
MPSRPFGYPLIVQVEPANFCNLSCPLCFTTSETSSRLRSIMPFETFKKLIDEVGDYLLLIVLWNWGEPFLNPDIFRMIKYAKSKNICIHCSTNGNVRFDEERAEELVDSGLDTLIVAVDGATEETYKKYRKGGSLQKVLKNIRTITDTKKTKGAETPRLNLRFVVMRHNEREIPSIKKLAKELDVDFLSFKTVDLPPHLGENLDNCYVPENQKYQKYEYEAQGFTRREKPFTCMRPWKRIVVDALGDIIPCEYDYKSTHSFGKINGDKSAMALWKGANAVDFRKNFNTGWNDYYLCKDCTYKNMTAEECVIEKIELKP